MSAPNGGGPSGDPQRYPGPMAYAGIGMLNAICLLGGAAAGWWADSALGTLPLLMLTGMLAGAALGVLGTRAELRRYRRPG